MTNKSDTQEVYMGDSDYVFNPGILMRLLPSGVQNIPNQNHDLDGYIRNLANSGKYYGD